MNKENKPENQDFVPKGIRTVNEGEVRKWDPKSVSERLLARPVLINLFTDSPDRIFDSNSLADYLKSTLGLNFSVVYYGDITSYALEQDRSEEQLASSLGKAKLLRWEPYGSWANEELRTRIELKALKRDREIPFREYAIQEAETANLQDAFGNYYYNIDDLGAAFYASLPQDLRTSHEKLRQVNLVITGRGVGEKEVRDFIHMRGGFTYGSLAVVSTTGLVEAPGKPIDVERSLGEGFPMIYDEERHKQAMKILRGKFDNSINSLILREILDEVFHDKMLKYEDERLNEAVKGITLSMLMFALGEAKAGTCSTTDLLSGMPDTTKVCRLHDAHWQEELIATQIKARGQREFCDYHEELFGRLQSGKPNQN